MPRGAATRSARCRPPGRRRRCAPTPRRRRRKRTRSARWPTGPPASPRWSRAGWMARWATSAAPRPPLAGSGWTTRRRRCRRLWRRGCSAGMAKPLPAPGLCNRRCARWATSAQRRASANLGGLQLRRDDSAARRRHYREAAVLFARLGAHAESVRSDIGLADALAAPDDLDASTPARSAAASASSPTFPAASSCAGRRGAGATGATGAAGAVRPGAMVRVQKTEQPVKVDLDDRSATTMPRCRRTWRRSRSAGRRCSRTRPAAPNEAHRSCTGFVEGALGATFVLPDDALCCSQRNARCDDPMAADPLQRSVAYVEGDSACR